MPASRPTTNGDLRRAYDEALAAWHACAAQVDMIDACQARAEARSSQGEGR